MEGNNKKSYKIIIIILITIILGLIVFICYDNFFTKKINNDEIKEEIKSKTTPISIDSETVKNAMNSFKNIRIEDDDLYNDNGYNISNISNLSLLLTATDNLDKKYYDPCDNSYKAIPATIEVLNSVIKKYILDKNLSIDDVKTLIEKNELYFINLKSNGVIIEGACDGFFEKEDYQAKKVIKAEIDGELLYVYEKTAFARYLDNNEDYEESYLVNYYKDYNRTTVLEKNIQSIDVLENNQDSPVEPNWDLYDTYKYTFKKINGAYYFQSLELNK